MATKKNFTQTSPALAYIDISEDHDEVLDDKNSLAEKKDFFDARLTNQNVLKAAIIPIKDTETKSKRIQVLLQPSVYDAVKQIANKHNTSVNDTINSLLKASTIGVLDS